MQEKRKSKGEEEKRVSLGNIIKRVLHDKGIDDVAYDSNEVILRRALNKLFVKLGADIETYKHKNVFGFYESEVPFMKSLLFQLYDKNGIISSFVNDNDNKNKKFSSEDVRDFLKLLKEEIEKVESEEKKEELTEMAIFFSNLFLWSPLRCVEDCHKWIDKIAMELKDIPVNQQSYYLGTIEHILKKEVALRITESTMEINKLAEIIESSKKENKDDVGIQNYYYESNPEIRFYYMQRDKRVLEAIQEDAGLRHYIEKRFGRKAEEIFNYAKLDM